MRQKIRIQRFVDTRAAAKALEDTLRAAFSASTPGAPHGVMLAGGRTPLQVYNSIASDAPDTPFSGYLILSDERYVPASDDQANIKQIAPLVSALRIPPDRVVYPPTDLPLPEATDAFGTQFNALVTSAVNLSVGILGIGSDGHTASLFTVEQTERGGGDNAPWAQSTGLYQGTERISLSSRGLLAFQRLIFFVTGEDKRKILEQLLHTPETFPAGRVLTAHSGAEIWSDVAPEGAGFEYTT
jgi:6-phosphogluconolactonase